jgi:hypothetical protein
MVYCEGYGVVLFDVTDVFLLVEQGYMYVMGGRAREFVELPEERSIGGIIGK